MSKSYTDESVFLLFFSFRGKKQSHPTSPPQHRIHLCRRVTPRSMSPIIVNMDGERRGEKSRFQANTTSWGLNLFRFEARHPNYYTTTPPLWKAKQNWIDDSFSRTLLIWEIPPAVPSSFQLLAWEAFLHWWFVRRFLLRSQVAAEQDLPALSDTHDAMDSTWNYL